jgi:hypothetical protein
LQFKSAGVYALGNASVGLVGVALTVQLARLLGSDAFGALASLIAFQNIWAGLGFMRIETRLATSINLIEADKILQAGFLAGGLVSILVSLITGFIWGWNSQIPLVFLSGFALSVLDALAARHAFNHQKLSVIGVRALRILGPLLLSVLAAHLLREAEKIFMWQSLCVVILMLLVWRRWIGWAHWCRVCVTVVSRHWRGLLPSIIFCLLNGLWLNGLTPLLNVYSSSALAGQFALLQRVLGGGLGIVSTATALVFAHRSLVRADLRQVLLIFLANLACAVGFSLFAAIAFLSGWFTSFLGDGWTYQTGLFFSTSLFLIASYSVGAISALTTRLRDEWFLTMWQGLAILMWIALFIILPSANNLYYALNLGALMHVLLGIRWFTLLRKNQE